MAESFAQRRASLRSAPAEKQPPRPVTMTTSTSSRTERSPAHWINSRMTSVESALRCAGRFSKTRATRREILQLSVPYIGATPCFYE
ncbi:MAG: hypothetical protein A3I63_03970 [Betaproteobacteria bacterium RIFCSPLOWO2_02_FULL_66_14]|nr:MAG: hypothetical protein A3I63_03970 [Betaproteobacteria bacterium RIFCSPLOWO2_02_FULL_66_14]